MLVHLLRLISFPQDPICTVDSSSLEYLAPARRRTTKSVGLHGETPVLCDAARTTATFSHTDDGTRKGLSLTKDLVFRWKDLSKTEPAEDDDYSLLSNPTFSS